MNRLISIGAMLMVMYGLLANDWHPAVLGLFIYATRERPKETQQ